MLMNQATALQCLFVRLVERGMCKINCRNTKLTCALRYGRRINAVRRSKHW